MDGVAALGLVVLLDVEGLVEPEQGAGCRGAGSGSKELSPELEADGQLDECLDQQVVLLLLPLSRSHLRVYGCTGVQVYRCTGVQVYRCRIVYLLEGC